MKKRKFSLERHRAVKREITIVAIMISLIVVVIVLAAYFGADAAYAKVNEKVVRERTEVVVEGFAVNFSAEMVDVPQAAPDAQTIQEIPEVTETSDAQETQEVPGAPYTDKEIDMLAMLVWGEARGCAPEEQACVAWTVFNRVDDPGFPDTINDVIVQPGQFYGYALSFPVDETIRGLCLAEAEKWVAGEEAPIVVPYATTSDYRFFTGDGHNNWFTTNWR